jgi:two-component system sensor histidine kinase ChiS
MKNIIYSLTLLTFIGKSYGQNFTNYTSNDGLADNIVNSIAIENDGIKWFGTRNGISKLDGAAWTTYSETDGLVDNDVTSMAIDNQGNKWIGTYGGLSVYNGSTWTNYTTANDLTNNHITSIVIDNDNNKWISTFGGGLLKFDGTAWTSYRSINGAVFSDYIISSHKDNQGQLWICYYFGGVTRINGDIWTFIPATSDAEFIRGSIKTVYNDSEGNHWFGSSGWGVSMLAADSTFTAYVHSDGASYREKNMVNTIEKDSDNKLWCGTWGAGIMKFDGTNWTNVTTKNSNLIDDHIYAIKKDNLGSIWICTYGGISKLDKVTEIEELNNSKDFSVFPNPSNGEIKITKYRNFSFYNVFNNVGQLIQTGKCTMNQSEETIFLQSKSGVYILELVDDSGNIKTEKLILN